MTADTSGASGQPLLTLSKVNKSFGAVHVLRDVDFSVRPGRVTALVGDNGAGKSTLIKAIAGIHAFDSGTYTFEGAEVHVTDPKQANALGIEVVYQDLAMCRQPRPPRRTFSWAVRSPRASGPSRSSTSRR